MEKGHRFGPRPIASPGVRLRRPAADPAPIGRDHIREEGLMAPFLVDDVLDLVGKAGFFQPGHDGRAELTSRPGLVVGPRNEQDRGADLFDGDRRLLDRRRVGLGQRILVKRDIGGEFPFHFLRFILGRGLEGHKRKRPSVEAPGRHRPNR